MATSARAVFQDGGAGPCQGYEVDNAILSIDAKNLYLKTEDPTGKAVFDQLLISGPNAFELHQNPKGRTIAKRESALSHCFYEIQKCGKADEQSENESCSTVSFREGG